jgi:hypothetical protein
MNRYILVENYSGYIFADERGENPVDAVLKFEREMGGDARNAEEKSRPDSSNEPGYWVYGVPADWPPVEDGTAQATIDALEVVGRRLCFVATLPPADDSERWAFEMEQQAADRGEKL